MTNPTPAQIEQLARNLHEAGLVDLDKPMSTLTATPALRSGDGTGIDEMWNAAFGSNYCFVYKT